MKIIIDIDAGKKTCDLECPLMEIEAEYCHLAWSHLTNQGDLGDEPEFFRLPACLAAEQEATAMEAIVDAAGDMHMDANTIEEFYALAIALARLSEIRKEQT